MSVRGHYEILKKNLLCETWVWSVNMWESVMLDFIVIFNLFVEAYLGKHQLLDFYKCKCKFN